jgi:hypothetical protein
VMVLPLKEEKKELPKVVPTKEEFQEFGKP